MKLLKVKNLAHLFGIVWLLSIAAFFGTILFGLKGGNALTEQNSTVLVFIVITGIFAFLGASILYMVHYLFLRKKALLGTSGSRRMGIAPLVAIVIVLLFVGAVSVRGAYNLGQAEKFLDEAKTTTPETTSNQAPIVTNTVRNEQAPVRYLETAQPTTSPVVQEEPKNNQNNLVSCYVYGQTFNLTPEKCRYYQSEEAGADKAMQNNDGYVPPYQNYGQSSTPVPTTAPEKYHSTQEACRQNCYATYKNYPDTSLFKQQCVNSCQ